MTVLKPSDAELHRIAAEVALKHEATFVGPAETYKYGVFRLSDGRTIELHLYLSARKASAFRPGMQSALAPTEAAGLHCIYDQF